MWKPIVAVVLSVTLMACGSDGKDGANGADGMNGSDGPAGPLNPPPALSSLSPTWGSGLTQVTIRECSRPEIRSTLLRVKPAP